MRKAFGALEANAVIERLARDNSQRRDTFAQLYDRFTETKRAARGLQRQVQDQQSELDQLRSQNAFLVDKMVPLKKPITLRSHTTRTSTANYRYGPLTTLFLFLMQVS